MNLNFGCRLFEVLYLQLFFVVLFFFLPRVTFEKLHNHSCENFVCFFELGCESESLIETSALLHITCEYFIVRLLLNLSIKIFFPVNFNLAMTLLVFVYIFHIIVRSPHFVQTLSLITRVFLGL